MKRHTIPLVLILTFSVIGMKALFHPDLFTAHDIWHQVARLYHYQSAAFGGQFPPYWISNLSNGFGYPLFFFSYHLPWILGLPLLFVGLGIPTTIKTLFVLSYLLSGIFMYSLAFSIFKSRMAGLLAGILYLWAPYRFLTILVGAAMGTSFVFVFLPILVWGMYISASDNKRVLGIILTAIGTGGIILSHLMTAFAVVPVAILFSVWVATQRSKDPRQFFKTITIGVILGLGISAFYLFPTVYYSRETQVSTGGFAQNYQHNFVNLNQLIYSKWGYGLFKESAKEGATSYQVGIAQWLSAIVLLSLILKKKLAPRLGSLGIFLLAGFVLSIFMMLDASRPIWSLANRFITLDFPTMFLLPATFLGSLFSGIIFIIVEQRFRLPLFLLLIFVALYTNRNHLRVNMYIDIPVSLVVSSETTTTSFHEYLPKDADIKFFSEENILVAFPSPSSHLPLPTSNFYQDANKLSFSVLAPQDMEISIRQFWFPGLALYLDSKKTEFTEDERGRTKFAIPGGWHNILVKFEDTSIIKLGKLTTLVSILILIALGKTYAKKT